MLGQPLGTTSFVEIYVPNLAPLLVAEHQAGGNVGLAWIVELDPISRTPALLQQRVAFGGGLDPLGLVGLGVTGTVDRKTQVAVPTRRYISLARGHISEDDEFIPGRLDRDRIDVRREFPEAGQHLTGFVAASSSVISLANDDGELDAFVTDEVMRDRPVRLKAAPTTRLARGLELAPNLSAFGTIFTGRATSVSVESDQIFVRVADDINRLDGPIQLNLYTGTGGIMGGKDLEGRPRPLNYGTAKGATPTLVDRLRLIYQVHDGEFLSVLVLDRGQALTRGVDVDTYAQLEALTVEGEVNEDEVPDIPIGHYATCRKEGYCRLGGAASLITCDVEGDGLRDGYIFYTGGIGYKGGFGYSPAGESTHRRYAGGMIFRILTTRGRFSPDEIDLGRITQFDQENPYVLGISIPSSERPTIRAVLTSIADSVGAVVVRNQLGQVFVRALSAPGGSSTINCSQANLAENGIERMPLPWGVPWPTVRLGYGRQWTPLGENDPAADLDSETAAALRRDIRIAEVYDEDVRALLPDRAPLELATLLRDESAAIIIANRLLSFYARFWGAWRVRVRGIGFQANPLDTVVVAVPRYGLTAGVPMLCIAVQERPGDYETELFLLG